MKAIALVIVLILFSGVAYAVDTGYGYKKEGNSKYVVVVPHALDDTNTASLGANIASRLNASLIVNNYFFKPSNKLAEKYPDRIEDFNKLSWSSKSGSYYWSEKVPEMKEFYYDLSAYALNINSSGEEPVIIHVHGMSNNLQDILVDIGCGAAEYEGELLGTDLHPSAGTNTGAITADLIAIQDLQESITSDLSVKNAGTASIGVFYPAWSMRTGTQYTIGYAQDLQLEVAYSLRRSNKVDSTAVLLSENLKETFG